VRLMDTCGAPPTARSARGTKCVGPCARSLRAGSLQIADGHQVSTLTGDGQTSRGSCRSVPDAAGAPDGCWARPEYGGGVATVGESIENPISGERVVWIATAVSSGGELLTADLQLRPGAAVCRAAPPSRAKRSVFASMPVGSRENGSSDPRRSGTSHGFGKLPCRRSSAIQQPRGLALLKAIIAHGYSGRGEGQMPALSRIFGKVMSPCRNLRCLLALAVAVPFLVPAAARADRAPTKGERAAIERVVRRSNAGPHVRITVSDVRISTADPHWAKADYSVHFQKSGAQQDVETIYHRANGRGWNTSYSQRPAAVEADLGWADSHLLETIVRTATFVVIGIIALLILSALAPSGGAQTARGSGPARRPSPRYEPPEPTGPREKTCSNCGGSRTTPCNRCHGMTKVPNPYPPPEMKYCLHCSGRGSRDCELCRGTGKVPA
jgi:hypothetical protein